MIMLSLVWWYVAMFVIVFGGGDNKNKTMVPTFWELGVGVFPRHLIMVRARPDAEWHKYISMLKLIPARAHLRRHTSSLQPPDECCARDGGCISPWLKVEHWASQGKDPEVPGGFLEKQWNKVFDKSTGHRERRLARRASHMTWEPMQCLGRWRRTYVHVVFPGGVVGQWNGTRLLVLSVAINMYLDAAVHPSLTPACFTLHTHAPFSKSRAATPIRRALCCYLDTCSDHVPGLLQGKRGNHLSNTTCVTQVFFKCGRSWNKLRWSSKRRNKHETNEAALDR